jgi:hypothetical protein
LTLDGKQFDRDAVKGELMKQLPDADRERLGLPPLTAGGNASDAGRQQSAGTNPTEKPGNSNNLEGIEIRSREEQEFVNGLSPHLTREQVQTELEGFRRRNGTADGIGGSKPPTNDTPPAAPETARPLQFGAEGSILRSADEAYTAIRASTTDVADIASNTGYKVSNIQKVKNHLFMEEHFLDRYESLGVPAEWRPFDSDIAIAEAWTRLETGTFGPADLQLLRHETAEAWYMRNVSPNYNAAHNAAQHRFPAPE